MKSIFRIISKFFSSIFDTIFLCGVLLFTYGLPFLAAGILLVIFNWKSITNWYDERQAESYTTEYKEYCEKGEFQEAYEACNKLERYKSTSEDERYIIIHEATSVLESQGVEGLPKIAFIVKEHNADWLYKELVDIAEAMGNDELENRLKKLAGTSSDDDSNVEE